MSYLAKFKGRSQALPPRASLTQITFAGLGALGGIGLIGWLASYTGQSLILGSLGASCVLLFAYPDSPFSQPRNVVFGHFISTAFGLLFLHYVGTEWWSMALALAVAIMVMQLTSTVHPPAGSNPLIVFLTGANFSFLLTPGTLGPVLLVVWALIYNNLSRHRHYPCYW